jgi:hypothetical protein
MIRVLFTWVLITAIIIGITYFTDKATKKEVGRWSIRLLQAGVVSALGLGIIIFLERL